MTIESTDGKGVVEELSYDSLIICTGGEYSGFWRDPQAASKAEAVSKAKSVLVVGGGFTGVEAAAHLAENRPGTKVGICTRSDRLLGPMAGGHERASTVLSGLGVHIHLETSFEAGMETKMGYDHVLYCQGPSFAYTLDFMVGSLKACVDPKTHRIAVNLYGQVCNNDPASQQSYSRSFPNIFCFGDVCKTWANEEKNISSLHQYCGVISRNVLVMLENQDSKKEQEWNEHLNWNLETIPKEFAFVASVPLGNWNGLFATNGWSITSPLITLLRWDLENTVMGEARNSTFFVYKQGFMDIITQSFLSTLRTPFCLRCTRRSKRLAKKKD